MIFFSNFNCHRH